MMKYLRMGIMCLVLAVVFSGAIRVQAKAQNPDKPKISVTVSGNDGAVFLDVSKTKNADGYEIFVKVPDGSGFESAGLIKMSGKKVRHSELRMFYPGRYVIKLKAYKKDGKKKVWSDFSNAAKADVDLGAVVGGIRFADNAKTEFTLGGKAKGETEGKPYTYKFECDEGLEDADVQLVFLTENGQFDMNPVFSYADETHTSISAIRRGYATAALYAYAPETAEEPGKLLAVSKKLKIRSVDENGLTGFEPVKYATITFKNGYAYFGEAPVELITDKTLVSEILKQKEDHSCYEYKGDRYFYNEKDKRGPFKFVAAEWRVLKRTKKYALLMTNYILKGGGYDGYADVNTTTWKTCCLNYMLNDSFSYTKSERTYWSILEVNDRVLMEMDIAGAKTKVGIPTVEMLTNSKYGFGTSKGADSKRIVKPSKYYDIDTNHNATKNGLSVYGLYWVANEKPGEAIAVDASGKINEGTFKCNVYEIGVVNVVKVDLTQCDVIDQ